MKICLSAIPEFQLASLSVFEHEQEVLILLEAIFRVVAIEISHLTPHTQISSVSFNRFFKYLGESPNFYKRL